MLSSKYSKLPKQVGGHLSTWVPLASGWLLLWIGCSAAANSQAGSATAAHSQELVCATLEAGLGHLAVVYSVFPVAFQRSVCQNRRLPLSEINV